MQSHVAAQPALLPFLQTIQKSIHSFIHLPTHSLTLNKRLLRVKEDGRWHDVTYGDSSLVKDTSPGTLLGKLVYGLER